MQLTAEKFQKWASKRQKKVADKDGIENEMGIVPTPSLAMRNIKNAGYLPRHYF